MQQIHNFDLEVCEPKEIQIELSVKNYLLFAMYGESITAFTTERYLAEASNYYNKLETKYTFMLLDEESYERLYNKFLELRTDKTLETMQEDSTEEDISLVDFLRTSSDILTSEESAPIIKFVNALFYQAIKKRASDIHIEPMEKEVRIRYRIDGILRTYQKLPVSVKEAIIARYKIMP